MQQLSGSGQDSAASGQDFQYCWEETGAAGPAEYHAGQVSTGSAEMEGPDQKSCSSEQERVGIEFLSEEHVWCNLPLWVAQIN